MNWYNLRENKCPKCSKVIDPELKFDMFRCLCGFSITPKKYQEIIESRDRWQPLSSISKNKYWRPRDEEQE